MPNDFPTSPEVLASASPWSLNDLAIMSPTEMSPEAELAYIGLLRKQRERYERALGQRAAPTAKAKASAKSAAVLAGGLDPLPEGEDLF